MALSQEERNKRLQFLKNKMYNICGNEYTLLSTEYINARTKIKVRHNTCGTVFEVRPDAFFREKGYTRCPRKECVQQRIKNTNLKRFGYECCLASPKIRDKVKKTMQKKYGSDSFFKNGLIQSKMKEKYGLQSSHQLHIEEPYATMVRNEQQLIEWSKTFQEKNKTMPNLLDFCNVSGYSPSAVYKILEEENIEISKVFNTSSSTYESIIARFLNDNGIQYEVHNRVIISPLELDFYIPDFKIAIEVNGAFFHNSSIYVRDSKPPKDKFYHQKKSIECESKGIRLIHIFEWDLYKENLQKTLSFLRSVFHINQYKIFARKCVINNIDNITANSFYEENHLQGKTNNCQYNYGLFYNNELVACMSFLKRKEEYSLTRFCSKKEIEVVGGASKLFKHFVKCISPNEIISFSDITKMSGNVYKILGFKVESITTPSYWWFKNPSNYHWRRECQKQYMHKLPGFDPDYKYLEHKLDPFWQRTEKEIMESKKYIQVFDSGMRKHIWRKEENDARGSKKN